MIEIKKYSNRTALDHRLKRLHRNPRIADYTDHLAQSQMEDKTTYPGLWQWEEYFTA